jgi:rRNA maturation endonuclease Nob1
MELEVKSHMPEYIQQIILFSKQTGNDVSLSKVDLEVLALALVLEKEGYINLNRILQTSPKRMIGLGHIQSLEHENED